MSEGEVAAPAPAAQQDKRQRAEEVLRDILGHMGVRARLEVKETEGEQAAISVALFPEEDIPGVVAGKRSQVVDALQFLANKIVNRGPDKKWINIGIGGHPEPRQPQQKQPKAQAQQAQQPTPAPAPAQEKAPPQQPKQGRNQRQQQKQQQQRAQQQAPVAEEAEAPAAEEAELVACGRALAQKSAELGRIFAVTAMGGALRASLARGADGVAGMRLKTEGDGRHKRLVFWPDNPKPMPKKSAMPDYDDEEELEE